MHCCWLDQFTCLSFQIKSDKSLRILFNHPVLFVFLHGCCWLKLYLHVIPDQNGREYGIFESPCSALALKTQTESHSPDILDQFLHHAHPPNPRHGPQSLHPSTLLRPGRWGRQQLHLVGRWSDQMGGPLGLEHSGLLWESWHMDHPHPDCHLLHAITVTIETTRCWVRQWRLSLSLRRCVASWLSVVPACSVVGC